MEYVWHTCGTFTASYLNLILIDDAQYAKKFGKFFGAKNDDLSKFQIT